MEAKANGPKQEEPRRTGIAGPTNPLVTPLLSDLYQFTMAYAYWKAGKHNERAVFDLYFRKNPFGGEYTVFAGLEECIRLIANFKFTAEEIAFIKTSLPKTCEGTSIGERPFDFFLLKAAVYKMKKIVDHLIIQTFSSGAKFSECVILLGSNDFMGQCKLGATNCVLEQDGFYNYLRGVDCSDVEVYAVSEGSVVFPKVPLLRVEGPIAIVQLLETSLLNLINYASLVATNAARHRFVAGKSKLLLEFGLRRAQGPDGGIGASKYSYLGGFDATR
ncbi:nicotinate phosphoribosyltransferase 2 [Actinidia rufa]|uniref:nicotinate phosphoribosyltransferase n=1 Tax=Actinidia rufa TaxID=165716 RepID=A0A7J0DW54_9ERIC|nr:nicotinate phosphoribosyltransferase 2 [Actinidia rufa]